MGAGKTPLGTVTLHGWARWLAGYVELIDEQVILVGHSRGGAVISQAAEYADGRIKQLVYLSAFLLPNGDCLQKAAAKVASTSPPESFQMATDGTSRISPEAIGPMFYNRTNPERVARAIEQMTAEPMSVFTEPLRLSNAGFGRIPRAYIESKYDVSLPLALQRSMQALLPCGPVVTLETDHSPFYSDPEGLAKALCFVAAA
jgi:pimeloyl-ACP methyl ester carboxylesterase